MSDTIPPNAKVWDDDDRELIHERLPGYMRVPQEYSDLRVGMWFIVGMGGSVRISQISREKRAIEFVFDQLGVDVEIPLVGSECGRIGYKVEIQNWVSEGNL